MADKRKNTARFVTIDQAVYGALADIQEDESRYEQFLKWALDCYSDLERDVNITVTDTVLKMTPYKSVQLPADCIDWLIIGVQCGATILSFTNDPNMALNYDRIDDPTCKLEQAETSSLSDVFYTSVGDEGEDLGKRFSRRLSDNGVGYWQDNKMQNEIQFRSDLVNKGDVFLRYISDQTIAGKETLIPRNAVRLIERYIHWMDHEESRDRNKNRLAPRKEELYWKEFDRFLANENPWDVHDILEAFFDSYSLVPKT